MRYDKEHKSATRRRIIETAGRRLRQDGIDGAGVSTLMSDAGLTNGAFYAHFGSKQELVAAALSQVLQGQTEEIRERGTGSEAFGGFIRDYLSPWHRDNRAEGCPSAALLDEVGRCDDATRQAYTESVVDMIDSVAGVLGSTDPVGDRARLLSVYAMLVGTLQLARTLTDEALSDAVLEQGVQNALRALA